jgi:Protein of unknown function (DUF2029).
LTRWRWRGSVALLAVAVGFVIYPLVEGENDVINSDWPAFATGARLIVENPSHLYDFDAQRRVELEVTGGRSLVTLGIHGILPFLAPAWVALIAVPFEMFGTNVGGRLWILFGLACLGFGLHLAVRPRPPAQWLPAFASVPTALMLLNAQLDGLVALGIGAAIALWSKPYLAGLALGLTLVKPQLVVPLALALLLARLWRVLAGYAAAGALLWASTAALNPRWVVDWLGSAGTTVQPAAREVDLSHLGTLVPAGFQLIGGGILALVAIFLVLKLAQRRRQDFQAATAVLVAGGVLAALHALPADLVLVAVALAIWGRAAWYDWVALSVGATVCAITPAPTPAIVGVLVIAWVVLRAGGVIPEWRRGSAQASAG